MAWPSPAGFPQLLGWLRSVEGQGIIDRVIRPMMSVTPAEERTLTSGALVEEGDGLWIGGNLQTTE